MLAAGCKLVGVVVVEWLVGYGKVWKSKGTAGKKELGCGLTGRTASMNRQVGTTWVELDQNSHRKCSSC